MKTIKFNEVEYKLVYTVFEGAAKLRAMIYKENHDIPSVSADANGCENIVIKEDGEEIAQYNGFSSLVGIQIFSDYPVNEGTDKVICIDIVNTNIQAQIDSLTSQLSSVQESQATTDAAIAELGDTVSSVSEVNDVQDLAIEDLSEAVNTITPEEE